MSQMLSDVLRIMRLAIGRRNENDPDSNDETLTKYINDFINLTMSDDVKLFEQYGTINFDITDAVTTGVYSLADLGLNQTFANICVNGFITLKDPVDSSVSWNSLIIYTNPVDFYEKWGVNNTDILVTGYPTEMLFYGNDFVFRTIPNDTYSVILYGYKINPTFSAEGDPDLPFDYWLRYIAYGAAMNYARDYRFDVETRQMLKSDLAYERGLLLSRTHNQIKQNRCIPRY